MSGLFNITGHISTSWKLYTANAARMNAVRVGHSGMGRVAGYGWRMKLIGKYTYGSTSFSSSRPEMMHAVVKN